MTVLARRTNHRDMRIVVRQLRTALLEHVEQVVAGGFAIVIDVGLVGEADDEHAGTVDGFLLFVERLCRAINDVLRH